MDFKDCSIRFNIHAHPLYFSCAWILKQIERFSSLLNSKVDMFLMGPTPLKEFTLSTFQSRNYKIRVICIESLSLSSFFVYFLSKKLNFISMQILFFSFSKISGFKCQLTVLLIKKHIYNGLNNRNF